MSKDPRAALHYFGSNQGLCVSYTNTEPDQIHPCDIALSLSRQARGVGHDSSSVAQHCLITAFLMLDVLGSLPAKERPFALLYALFHDASEAYTGDLPMPLIRTLRDLWHENAVETAFNAVKTYHQATQGLPLADAQETQLRIDITQQVATRIRDPFETVEKNLYDAIYLAFGLQEPSAEMKALVRLCDKGAIAIEMRDVMSHARVETFMISGYKFPEPRNDIRMKPLSQPHAEIAFLKAITHLTQAAKLAPDIFEKQIPNLRKLLFVLAGLQSFDIAPVASSRPSRKKVRARPVRKTEP